MRHLRKRRRPSGSLVYDIADLEVTRNHPRTGVGISFSGGGIRSASFCLGVLQCLQEHNYVHGPQGAQYLSSVSGGSYMASALALVSAGNRGDPLRRRHEPDAVRAQREKSERDRVRASQSGAAVTPVDPDWVARPLGELDGRPFHPGTPEERYVRDHTMYFTHGPGGVVGVAWRVLLGVLVNLALVVGALNTVARPLGWIYAWGFPGLANPRLPFGIPGGVSLTAVILAILALLAGLAWVAYDFPDEDLRKWVGMASGGLAGAAILVAAFGVGLPDLLRLLRVSAAQPAGAAGANAASTGITTGTAVGLGGLLLSCVVWVSHMVGTGSGSTGGAVMAKLKAAAGRYRGTLLNVLALISGPVLLGCVFVLLTYSASRPLSDHLATELLAWLLPLAALFIAWWWGDLVAWSLHSFYKQRLSSEFALCRVHGDGPLSVGGQVAVERPYRYQYNLSIGQHIPEFPELIICAAANVSNYGDTPGGANVTSFVFGSEWIGGPLVGYVPTRSYERWLDRVWGPPITIPTAMAISGAAVAPSMGYMTRSPLRFWMAVANLRLGVWTPNPRRMEEAGDRPPAKRMRARPDYLVREMIGLNHIDAPFLYVTDGGHYENLGLVELLRRGCLWIWCVDGSGDQIDTFSTLGHALSLARSELGVTVDIQPECMAPNDDKRFVAKPYCVGSIKYPRCTEHPDGGTGTLVVIKLGVPANAPADVLAYQASHPEFPCDPTIDQLYTAETFDAYRELGRFAAQEALSDPDVQTGLSDLPEIRARR